LSEPLWTAGGGTGERIDVSLAPARLEPVFIEHVRVCHFKRKPDEGGHRRLGCARCGKAKADRDHMGQPPSVNPLGSGDMRAYQAQKQQWESLLSDLLAASDLPKGLAHVLVEGEATFPTRAPRDQGNHRFMLEKALGDALERGGWIENDDWSRYEFGNLTASYEKGVSATRLVLFPTLPAAQ
jgi:hypothetical protein